MKKFFILIMMLTCFAFLISNTNFANAIPILEIQPNTITALPGETFTVDIAITGENIINVAAWQAFISFDPSIISFHRAINGNFTWPNPFFFSNEPTSGDLRILALSTALETINGQGTIAKIDFTASSVGITSITLVPSGVEFIDPIGNSIPVQISTSAQVNVVPEPSSILLVTLGFISFVGLRKR